MYAAVAEYARNFEFARVYGSNAGVGHFFYGPLSLVLLGWMPLVSYGAVKVLWVCLNTVAYVVFWWGLYRLYPFLQEKKTSWLWFLVWVVSIKPIHATFQSHNVQLMIAALLVLCEVSSRSANRTAQFFSGWGPVLAGQVKVFPFFMAAYTFVLRSTLVRIGILVAAVVGAIIPLLYFGTSQGTVLYSAFIGNLSSFHEYAPLTKDAVTLSLASLIATWFSPLIGMPASLMIIKILGLILCSLFFLFVIKNRNETDERYPTHVWALGVALMALVNSSTRPDYFIFFVPAFASLSEIWQRSKVPTWFVAGTLASLALIALICEWTLGSRDLNHKLELLRLPVVGMIILCLVLVSGVKRLDKFQNAPRIPG